MGYVVSVSSTSELQEINRGVFLSGYPLDKQYAEFAMVDVSEHKYYHYCDRCGSFAVRSKKVGQETKIRPSTDKEKNEHLTSLFIIFFLLILARPWAVNFLGTDYFILYYMSEYVPYLSLIYIVFCFVIFLLALTMGDPNYVTEFLPDRLELWCRKCQYTWGFIENSAPDYNPRGFTLEDVQKARKKNEYNYSFSDIRCSHCDVPITLSNYHFRKYLKEEKKWVYQIRCESCGTDFYSPKWIT